MRKITLLLIIFLTFILVGCQLTSRTNVVSVNKPPKVFIEIDGDEYPTVLGTYCWVSNGMGECADTGGPEELLSGKEPIQVSPGERVNFIMNYAKPDQVYLVQISDTGSSELTVTDDSFEVPEEVGIYYYSYGVWWTNVPKNAPSGDASYAFAIEVK